MNCEMNGLEYLFIVFVLSFITCLTIATYSLIATFGSHTAVDGVDLLSGGISTTIAQTSDWRITNLSWLVGLFRQKLMI